MAKLLLSLASYAVIICTAGGAPPPCCSSKTVGGVEYTLRQEQDTSAYNCLSNCIFEKVEEPGPLFCFAEGDLEVVCDDPLPEQPEGSESGNEGPPSPTPAPTPVPAPSPVTFPTPVPVPPPSPVPAPEPASCTYPDGHTMNLYAGPADVCGYELKFSGLDQDTKDLILDKHNQLRQKVSSGSESGQPGATNMRKLVWNDELATTAQRWASQCQGGHDATRGKCDGTVVGQNAYEGSSSLEDDKEVVLASITKAAQAWYNEVTNPGFSSANINPFVYGDGWGHYSQVAWAETSELGCGLVYYETEDEWFNTLVVCNYAIAGNLEGGEMYETGTGCGNCPAETACDATYDALCASTTPAY